MSKLIIELEEEHIKIRNFLEELHEKVMSREKKLELLLQAKNLLSNHIAKEDELLYPKLNKAAETDFLLKKTLNIFAGDTENVSILIHDFFDKYSKNNSISNTEFMKDIAKFTVSLKNRLIKEEIGIYKAYEKLQID